MERKFKIGDKVEVAVGNKGVIVDEIYNQITGRLFSVDCGENGMGLYKASALTLIEENPERKFKVGDMVRTPNKIVSKVVFISSLSDVLYPYLVEYSDSTYEVFGELDLTLVPKCPEPKYNVGDKVKVSAEGIEPFEVQITSWAIAGSRYFYTFELEGGRAGAYSVETTEPRYKKGDEVFDKVTSMRVYFSEYCSKGVIVTRGGTTKFRDFSDIEPYTGQDKVDNKPEDSTHPFTVILKSGVKVGISATMFDFINEQPDIIGAVQTVEDGKFFLHQIEAIVPTENLMP